MLAPLLLCLFVRLQHKIAVFPDIQAPSCNFSVPPFFVLDTRSALLGVCKLTRHRRGLLSSTTVFGAVSSRHPSFALFILLLSGDVETNPGPKDDSPAAANPSKQEVLCVRASNHT